MILWGAGWFYEAFLVTSIAERAPESLCKFTRDLEVNQ